MTCARRVVVVVVVASPRRRRHRCQTQGPRVSPPPLPPRSALRPDKVMLCRALLFAADLPAWAWKFRRGGRRRGAGLPARGWPRQRLLPPSGSSRPGYGLRFHNARRHHGQGSGDDVGTDGAGALSYVQTGSFYLGKRPARSTGRAYLTYRCGKKKEKRPPVRRRRPAVPITLCAPPPVLHPPPPPPPANRQPPASMPLAGRRLA